MDEPADQFTYTEAWRIQPNKNIEQQGDGDFLIPQPPPRTFSPATVGALLYGETIYWSNCGMIERMRGLSAPNCWFDNSSLASLRLKRPLSGSTKWPRGFITRPRKSPTFFLDGGAPLATRGLCAISEKLFLPPRKPFLPPHPPACRSPGSSYLSYATAEAYLRATTIVRFYHCATFCWLLLGQIQSKFKVAISLVFVA